MAAEARPRAAPRAGPLGHRNPGGGRRALRPVRLPHRPRPRAGATDLRLGGPHTVDWILEQTGGFGADYTFEATGVVAVMRQAVESARTGWGCARSTAEWPANLDVQPFLSHELTLDEVNRGFELMEGQDGIRSVIRFG